MRHPIEREFLQQDNILAEMVRRIVEVYHPSRIYLFGSRALGTARADSDYDLLVIVPDDAPAELRKAANAYQILWGLGKSKDVLVCTETWFSTRTHLLTTLPAIVIREGKLLYAA